MKKKQQQKKPAFLFGCGQSSQNMSQFVETQKIIVQIVFSNGVYYF